MCVCVSDSLSEMCKRIEQEGTSLELTRWAAEDLKGSLFQRET